MAKPSVTQFDEELTNDLFSKVQGKSSLAKLSQQSGMPFPGTKQFVFSMSKEVDIVGENGKHTEGGVDITPVTMRPIEFEYGARISDAFMKAAEEEQIDILKNFNKGFAKKLAKGLDIAAFHGINPRTMTKSEVIGTNNFDDKVTQTVDYAAATADENLDDAIAIITEGDVNGIAMSKTFATAMGKIRTSKEGPLAFPAFRFGGCPTDLNGVHTDANVTVSKGPATYPDHAIVGDFENAFKWGYGKEVTLEVIEYGDPDNSGKDLKGYKQVYLRATAYLGWGVLAPEYFSRIVTPGA